MAKAEAKVEAEAEVELFLNLNLNLNLKLNLSLNLKLNLSLNLKLMLDKTFGHFEIIEKLGEGGMAEVYKAINTKLQRTVALKILKPQFVSDETFVKLFISEARKAASLHHPNIVTIYNADVLNGTYYIEMEFLGTLDLKKYIEEKGKLDYQDSIYILIPLLEALDYAYTEGNISVHRDIKPQNIMICEDKKGKKRAVLTDFGIARATIGTKILQTTTIIGTPEYMSPEQAEGKKLDFRSDIYSLGIVFYEMITGKVPFEAETGFSMALKQINETPIPPSKIIPDLPNIIEKIILKCIEKQADNRYQIVSEFSDELLFALDSLKSKEKPIEITSPEHEKLISRPKPKFYLAAGAIAIILLFVIILIKHQFIIEKMFNIKSVKNNATQGRHPEKLNIAVLKFVNTRSASSDDWIGDAFQQSLITKLEILKKTNIVDQNKIIKVLKQLDINAKNLSEGTIKNIAKNSGANAVIFGSFIKVGKQISAEAKVFYSEGNITLPAESEKGDFEQIITIVEKLAIKVTRKIRGSLTENDKLKLAERDIPSLSAYKYYTKGRKYYYQYTDDSLTSAIEMFKNALEIDPSYAKAYSGLSDSYAQKVDKFGYSDTLLENAIFYGKKAIELNNNLSEAHKALALVYHIKGDSKKAIEEYKKAIKIRSNYPVAFNNLGDIYLQIGDVNNAIIYLKKALELQPGYVYAYNNLGNAYSTMKNYAEAIRQYKKAISINPEYPEALFNIASIYLLQSNFNKAIEYYEKSIKFKPDYVEAYIYLGIALDNTGKKDRAISRWRKALELDPENETAKELLEKSSTE